MTRGTEIVEQINKCGEIVCDTDFRLQPNELFEVFRKYFPNVFRDDRNKKYIHSEYKDVKYLIRTKNITYLGNPHKKFRKRYQIPTDLNDFYSYAKSIGCIPLMVGVYTYDDVTIFVEFDIESYIDNVHNNSSAHVYSTDIQQVLMLDTDDGEEPEEGTARYGYFEKIDINGNRVTVFDIDSVDYFFENVCSESRRILEELNNIQLVATSEKKLKRESQKKEEIKYIPERLKTYGLKLLPNRTKNIILNYFEEIPNEWNGVQCYDMMLRDSYRNQNQSEWPGFYLEFSFEKYLERNNLLDVIHYEQDKVEGGIDLDLYLEEIGTYADLKAHSIDKSDIPGNKKETVEEVLKTKGQVIYIVCEHDTEKDSEFGYEVTRYWNTHKTNRKMNQNPLSYKNRMKNNVKLRRVNILSINSDNVRFLKGFTQGKNSNGKARKVKIMIDGKQLSKFLRLSYELA